MRQVAVAELVQFERGRLRRGRRPSVHHDQDRPEREGISFPNIYDHVKRALDPARMQETNPVAGGQMFPDIHEQKNIPGGGARNPLHRTPYSTDNAANRAAAEEACRKEFGSWLPDEEKKGKSCDEFPFAVTREGAAFATPRTTSQCT